MRTHPTEEKRGRTASPSGRVGAEDDCQDADGDVNFHWMQSHRIDCKSSCPMCSLLRAQRERMSSSKKPEELPEIGAVTPVLDPGLAVINNYCNISNCDTLVLSTALLPVYDFTST